jgi:hypothetical protein
MKKKKKTKFAEVLQYVECVINARQRLKAPRLKASCTADLQLQSA